MTPYPGYNTQFYIVLQQVVTGPIMGLDDLSTYNIEPDTPVWYDGLDDWKPAILAPLTNQLFTSDSEYFRYKNGNQSAESVAETTQDEVEVSERAQETIPEIPREEPSLQPEEQHATSIENDPYYFNQPGHQPVQEQEVVQPKKPSSYLVWAIVVTIVFSVICGVIAIIYSCKVKSKYNKGNYESAEKCSENAQWWIAIGICVGLISTVFQIFVGSLLPF